MFKELELNEGENRKVEIDFHSNEKCLSNCVLIFWFISNNILGAKKNVLLKCSNLNHL